MIHMIPTEKDNLIALKLEGKISQTDVQKMRPMIQRIADNGKKADFYFEMHDFHGYELKGLWEDIKVDAIHASDYGNMAFVGDKKWQEWAAKATDFFTGSEVKFFELEHKDDAMRWISK